MCPQLPLVLPPACSQLPLVCQLCVHNYLWSVSCVSTATSGLSAVCPQLPLVCQLCPQLPLVCQLRVHSYLWSVSCVSTATFGLSPVCSQVPLVCQLCVHRYLWSVSYVSTGTSDLSAVCPQVPLVCQLCVHSYLWSCHLCVHNCLEWHRDSLNKSWQRLQINVLCVCRCGPLHQAASPAQHPKVHHCWHSMAWLRIQMFPGYFCKHLELASIARLV